MCVKLYMDEIMKEIKKKKLERMGGKLYVRGGGG